jgi:hypothetical protein
MLTIEEKARRIQALSVAERMAEEARQATELVDLINDEITRHGEATELPMLNAVFAALMTVEAAMLAMLEPAARRAMIKAADRARPAYLANALTGAPRHVLTIKARRTDA